MTQSLSLTVDLGTEPGIKTVAALRDQLMTAIAQSADVVIRGDQVTRIDISALQVLAAAHHSATAAGCRIRLEAPLDGALQLALKRTGFVSAEGRPQTREGDFWILSTAAKDEAA